MDILPLKKAGAESIYTSVMKCLKDKNLQASKIIGMGFDGACIFSGKKIGVQMRLKKYAPHAIFVHCHCHLLQLACVQAASRTDGIKHVFTTLTTLWKYLKPAMISSDVRTEWRSFRALLVKQPADNTASQLKDLVTNDMLIAMFPNLSTIATVSLVIPVSTASVESFLKIKLIKTRLRNSLGEFSLSNLMRMSIVTRETNR